MRKKQIRILKKNKNRVDHWDCTLIILVFFQIHFWFVYSTMPCKKWYKKSKKNNSALILMTLLTAMTWGENAQRLLNLIPITIVCWLYRPIRDLILSYIYCNYYRPYQLEICGLRICKVRKRILKIQGFYLKPRLSRDSIEFYCLFSWLKECTYNLIGYTSLCII